MSIWQPANAIGRSSSLDGCLADIASRLPINTRHLATIASHLASAAKHPSVIASHLAATASRLAIAARHPLIIATQLAVIASHPSSLARHLANTARHHAMLARCVSNNTHHPIYFLVTPLCGVTRKYKRRQRFCLPHHQHRAEHHRPHPATRPRRQRGMELQSHLPFP